MAASTSSSQWFAKNDMNSSAVIDLSDANYLADNEGDDASPPSLRQPPGLASDRMESEGEMGPGEGTEEGEKSGTTLMDAMRNQMADSVWQASKQQARKAFDIYGNIDVLRPYFDVEPKVVVARLLFSLVPRKLTGNPQKVVGELYGPLMVVFTLIAVLLYGMKDSGHTVKEGTLMGSAIGVCFGYWLVGSLLFYTASYICNTFITFLQVLSLTGYAMFSYVVVLFLGTALHSEHSHTFFYSTWAILGGLAAAKMVMVYISRTTGKSQKLVIAGVVVSLHLLFLLYLHFSYHKIVEDMKFNFGLEDIESAVNVDNRAVHEAQLPNIEEVVAPEIGGGDIQEALRPKLDEVAHDE